MLKFCNPPDHILVDLCGQMGSGVVLVASGEAHSPEDRVKACYPEEINDTNYCHEKFSDREGCLECCKNNFDCRNAHEDVTEQLLKECNDYCNGSQRITAPIEMRY